jgi:hypothetical protein
MGHFAGPQYDSLSQRVTLLEVCHNLLAKRQDDFRDPVVSFVRRL